MGSLERFPVLRDNACMRVEQLEQIAALVVTAGLVAGNLLLFTPWRKGQEPRERLRERSQAPALLWPGAGRGGLLG
jgi:hypothetical protein